MQKDLYLPKAEKEAIKEHHKLRRNYAPLIFLFALENRGAYAQRVGLLLQQ